MIETKVLEDTQLLFLWALQFGKNNTEDRVQLLGSNILNCCLKITTADLCNRGLKMNCLSKILASPRVGPCPSLLVMNV